MCCISMFTIDVSCHVVIQDLLDLSSYPSSVFGMRLVMREYIPSKYEFVIEDSDFVRNTLIVVVVARGVEKLIPTKASKFYSTIPIQVLVGPC